MPLFRNADKLIFYAHIPKTGGGSLETALRDCGAKHALKYHKRQKFAKTTPQHIQAGILHHWVPASFYDTSLTVVRNPYARLLSEYKWRQQISKKDLPPFSEWVRKTFNDYPKNKYVMDNHIRPQVEFLTPDMKVFEFEKGLLAPMRYALGALGFDQDAFALERKHASVRVAVEVTDKTIEEIKAFYAKDFAKLGYDPDAIPEQSFQVRSTPPKRHIRSWLFGKSTPAPEPAPLAPPAVSSAPAPTDRKFLLAAVESGLGERLCALLNAIRLADATKLDFKLSWTPDVWNRDYKDLVADAPSDMVAQSITAKETIFAPEFLQNHALESTADMDIQPLPKQGLNADSIASSAANGWNVERELMDFKPFTDTPISGQDAFSQIKFTPRVNAQVAEAAALDLGNFTALHLRSGDLVFGAPRQWGLWADKVINPVVALDIIAKLQKDGQRVLLFGQDTDCLQQISAATGANLIDTIAPSLPSDTHERALFEIVLMSKAASIIGGHSGFTRTAAMISDQGIKGIFALYSATAYSDITLDGLAQGRLNIHPKMAAYSYWQAYAFGRDYRSAPKLLDIISKASDADPENACFALIKAALLFRLGQDKDAETLLQTLIGDAARDAAHPVVKQLLFRLGRGKHIHAEQFDDFIAAARRPGNANAAFLRPFIDTATQ